LNQRFFSSVSNLLVAVEQDLEPEPHLL